MIRRSTFRLLEGECLGPNQATEAHWRVRFRAKLSGRIEQLTEAIELELRQIAGHVQEHYGYPVQVYGMLDLNWWPESENEIGMRWSCLGFTTLGG